MMTFGKYSPSYEAWRKSCILKYTVKLQAEILGETPLVQITLWWQFAQIGRWIWQLPSNHLTADKNTLCANSAKSRLKLTSTGVRYQVLQIFIFTYTYISSEVIAAYQPMALSLN